jgi:hypothetical protein
MIKTINTIRLVTKKDEKGTAKIYRVLDTRVTLFGITIYTKQTNAVHGNVQVPELVNLHK